MNLLVPGTGDAQDVPQFLKQLDALSVFPTTRQDIITQLTSNLTTLKSKNELLIAQQAKLEQSAYNLNFSEHDVITITDTPSLDQVFSCRSVCQFYIGLQRNIRVQIPIQISASRTS